MLRGLLQVGLVVVVAALFAFLLGNMFTNLRRQGTSLGLGFLDQPALITIPGSDFVRTQSRLDAILLGIGNTFRVAIAGIILASILGVLIGIARLSKNWLLNTGARLYVEFFRNVPLLVIIVFAYLVVFLQMPEVDEAYTPLDLAVFYVRGIHFPWYEEGAGFGAYLLVLLGGLVAALVVSRWRSRVSDLRGTHAHSPLWGGGTFLFVAVIGYFMLGSPATISVPVFEDKLVVGGIRIAPEYGALLVSLVIYHASHIAEITRASIQAVPLGQQEAATALALSGYQRTRFVILPQAFRVAIPPLANQYLSLTKNSSLAVAISYFELTKVTEVMIGNGAPAPQSYTVLILAYLIISLMIAGLTNFVNRRVALVER